MKSRPRITICGMVALFSLAGVAWDYLQCVIGFARLGGEVITTKTPGVGPTEKTFTSDGKYSAQLLANFFQGFAQKVRERWHHVHLYETAHGDVRSRVRRDGAQSQPVSQRRLLQ